ncbi:alpha/beta hydrolase [Agromyces sp. NPDC056379]|uniref:alpha/beta hydrolase n=1 Tax=unclassified Agromyces TaxID=2639701 RepID=UPI0035DC92EA
MSTTEPQPYIDPFVEAIDLRSDLNGSDYEIRIGLPATYRSSSAHYPVLVVLDADLSFGIAYETTVLEAMWASAPRSGAKPAQEFIVVGISFPDRHVDAFRRNFEYMPEGHPEEYAPEMKAYLERVVELTGREARSGGAAVFLEVLTREILPLIERNYRVDPSRRMLFGQSAGGTFGCYTLLTRPETFTDYVIVSPGIPDGEIFRLEEAWANAHDDLPVAVQFSAGQGEVTDPLRIVSNTATLIEKLHSRHYPGLRLLSWFVPDANHIQTAAPSLARALSSL